MAMSPALRDRGTRTAKQSTTRVVQLLGSKP